jgi:hypothetical protein
MKRANLALDSFTATLDDLHLTQTVVLKIEESMDHYSLENIDEQGVISQVVSERRIRETNLTKLVNKCPNLKCVSFGLTPSFTVETLKIIDPKILKQLWELNIDIFAYNYVELLLNEISVHCSSLRKFHLKRDSECIIDLDNELIMDLPGTKLLVANFNLCVLIIDINCLINNTLIEALHGQHCPMLNHVKLIGPMDEKLDLRVFGSLCASYCNRDANLIVNGSLIAFLYSSTGKTSQERVVDIVLRDSKPTYLRLDPVFDKNKQLIRFFKATKQNKISFNHVTLWGFEDLFLGTFCAARNNDIRANSFDCVDCSLISDDGATKVPCPPNQDPQRWTKLEKPFHGQYYEEEIK